MSLNGGCVKATLEYSGPITAPIEIEVKVVGVKEGDFVKLGALGPNHPWLGGVRVIRDDVLGVMIGNTWPRTTIAVLYLHPDDAPVTP